ncbi:MAG TPA: hypothetical protein VND91_05555, partial [Candidatus Saccharimonadia bacterium]|nr:hypothetical protein [Candidatus Saccharimonadia bacterium]
SSSHGAEAGTQLWFGSAVVPIPDRSSGALRLGFGFDALIGFHKRYSVALLSAARKRLAQSIGVA